MFVSWLLLNVDSMIYFLQSSLQHDPVSCGLSSLNAALTALGIRISALPGNRTIVDALAPFCAVLLSDAPLQDAVMAVEEGAHCRSIRRPGE